jgi:uncharacterized membrane protein (DUF106 family)
MKGGGLDYTVVMIVVVLNLIAYLSVKDWTASVILVVGIAASQMVPYKSILLFLAVLVAALSRSVYVEGLEMKKEEEEEKEEKAAVMKVDKVDKISALEGLSLKANKLADKQMDLFSMAKDLGPMMERAESMMNKLPPGFLEHAMKNMGKK